MIDLTENSPIFKKIYRDYLEQISGIDLKSVAEKLGIDIRNDEAIIPFFEKYPLIVKEQSFSNFREIVLRLNNKEQDTKKGFERLINLVFIKFEGGKGKRKYSKEEILSNPQRLHVENR